jgi:aryl-alcohol dehydrogenase (NADP+)
MYQYRYWQEAQFDVVEKLAKECESRGVSLPSVAIAWVLAQPGVTSAIVGASRPDQLAATLAGATLALAPDLAKLCDEAWLAIPRRPVLEGYR